MDKQAYMLEQVKVMTGIPSPTGMTRAATDYLLAELTRLGFRPERTPKGAVLCCLGGEGHPLVLSAHVDTLGAMVRSIKGNGTLRYTQLGGYNDNAIENENVLIHTRGGKVYSGTVQSVKASRHVWGSTAADARNDQFLEVVIDEEVYSKADVEKLGIGVGDFISFDPRTVITESGYIKSRHLDDKASSAVLLTLAREVAEGRVTLGRKVTLLFTVYEEVGHGASPLYKMEIEDLLAVDMGCVGGDLTCKETQVSICAKDSAGPFDFDFTNELIARAKENGIDYAVDIYPRYSSDTATALRAGMDARFALCGQGVFASHAYERTHVKGMLATLALVTSVAEKV
ncbi:MAG: M42 family metallopeptidase [Clostridia bacterium]|nr:M42 family metallopeptidase [Clostridia bacterium]